jgi:hypothetical protein
MEGKVKRGRKKNRKIHINKKEIEEINIHIFKEDCKSF